MNASTIRVPNVLGGQPEAVDRYLILLKDVPTQSARQSVVFDMSAVRWIAPYGAIILLESCRYVAQQTGNAVCLVGLKYEVHAYLRRLCFFERAAPCAYTSDVFDPADDLSRSPESCNVLELFCLASPKDVFAAVSRARRILRYWLDESSDNMGRIVSLISEACSNAVDHSRDSGMLTIQKYERASRTDVLLAIGDLGQGIRESLSPAFGNNLGTDATYIRKALEGLSARPGGRGGLGLATIQRIATASGGSVHIRSGAGHVVARSSGIHPRDGLLFLPGTQISITFCSSPT